MLPWRSRPAADAVVAEFHPAEAAAVDVRDPVVLGQPLVEERVVGPHEIERAPVLPQDAADEQFRLAAHGLPEVVVEVREQPLVGGDPVEVA